MFYNLGVRLILDKKREELCKSSSHLFSGKWQSLCIEYIRKFEIWLTNDFVSFQQFKLLSTEVSDWIVQTEPILSQDYCIPCELTNQGPVVQN